MCAASFDHLVDAGPEGRDLTAVERPHRSCHIVSMANVQVVLVTTERITGAAPVRVVYYVAEENPAKAEAIVRPLMTPDEKVEAIGQLPEAAVKALGLKPGEFIHA